MKIELVDLVHTYPTGDTALKGITTVIDGTEPVAIIGQNGSGKTTLVKHFNGILRPTSGDVLLDGESINTKSTASWSKYIGYVFQNPDDQIFLNTVQKELEFGPLQIGMDKNKMGKQVEFASKLCGLENVLDKHPFDLTPTEKKFCTLASVISMDPQVLIFDEPTCGQDVNGVKRLSLIIDKLKSMGKLCIVISHDMKFVVENFSRIIVLCKGSILLDGGVEEVFSKPEELKKAFVSPPPITRVGQKAGLSKISFTVDTLVENILNEKKERN